MAQTISDSVSTTIIYAIVICADLVLIVFVTDIFYKIKGNYSYLPCTCTCLYFICF